MQLGAMRLVPMRLWVTEVIRGAITLSFGLLTLIAQHITLIVVFTGLGVYLIADGVVDIYGLASGKRLAPRTVAEYALSSVSIVLGVLCFTHPQVTVFFLIALLAARIIARGGGLLREARDSRGQLTGVAWLYGVGTILGGIALIALHILTFSLILTLIVIYALIDGFYLLARGLVIHFAPQLYGARSTPILKYEADIPATMPPTTRRGLVFVRREGAFGLGHIGWAFEWATGRFNAGSVENLAGKPYATPDEMDFWCAHTLDPVGTMARREFPYDEYKAFAIEQPQPKTAWQTVVWESRQPYFVIRHNCNDVAYDVLRAYGVTALLHPAEETSPNDWYDALPGPSFVIKEHPQLPLHIQRTGKNTISSADIDLTVIPAHIQGLAPKWRSAGRNALKELTLAWDKMLLDLRTLAERVRG